MQEADRKPTAEQIPKTHFTVPPEENVFESLVVDVTHRCNMECANCYIPNRDVPDMPTDRLFDLLARLPRRTYIRLMGGEPTVRDDLPELIRNIIAAGHKPDLVTNGLRLAQEDYCQSLCEAGLTRVVISMNGADDDAVYRIMDGGKYAGLKVRALRNALASRFLVNTGTIVARGVNEHVLKRQVDLIAECAQAVGVDFSHMNPWRRLPPVARFKSVGAIGRYMPNRTYALDELVELAVRSLNLAGSMSGPRPVASGLTYIREHPDGRNKLLRMDTRAGAILLRFVDWSVNHEGVPDAGNQNRGRVTKDFQIAPAFEDVKANEFQY